MEMRDGIDRDTNVHGISSAARKLCVAIQRIQETSGEIQNSSYLHGLQRGRCGRRGN